MVGHGGSGVLAQAVSRAADISTPSRSESSAGRFVVTGCAIGGNVVCCVMLMGSLSDLKKT